MSYFRPVAAVFGRALLLLCLSLGPTASALASRLTETIGNTAVLTLLAGSEQDVARGVAVDSAGNVYVTGSTYSDDFPRIHEAQPARGNHGSAPDAFVTKISPSGTIIYSTYLGGGSDDTGNAIAVDARGDAYVTGVTASNNFPTTKGALQPRPRSGPFPDDAFVTKLSPGGAIVYSTYLGGGYGDSGTGIAVNPSGAVTLTGYAGPEFPLVHPLQAQYRGLGEGGDDAFVARIDAAGKKLIYSTYLGGFDEGQAIAVDGAGNAYVTGTVRSTSFPTAHALQAKPGGGTCNDEPPLKVGCPDAFVAKLTPAGRLAYGTYLGGSGADYGAGIAVDLQGRAYVAGTTTSARFPGLLPAHREDSDAFLVMIGAAGRLIQSTRIGGTGSTVGYAVAARDGRVAVAAETGAQDVGPGGSQPWHGGFTDIVLTAYATETEGFARLYESYLGGNGSDVPLAVALDSAGHASIGGSTTSRSFGGATSVGTSGKRGDAFVVQVPLPDTPGPPATPTTPVSPTPGLSTKQLYDMLLSDFSAQRSFQLAAVVRQGGAYDATVRGRLRFAAPDRFRLDRLDRAYFPSDKGGPGRTIKSGSTEIQVGHTYCSGPINWICSPEPIVAARTRVENLLPPSPPRPKVHFALALTGPQPAVVAGFIGYLPTCPFYAICGNFSARPARYENTLTFDAASLLPLSMHSTYRYRDQLGPYEQATFTAGTYTIALPHYPRVACPGWVPKGSYCMKEPGR